MTPRLWGELWSQTWEVFYPVVLPWEGAASHPRGRAAPGLDRTSSWSFLGLRGERRLHSQCWDLILRNLLFSGVRQIDAPRRWHSETLRGIWWKDQQRDFACWSHKWCPSCQVCVEASMKLKKQVTVCGAAIFCVAVFSLYLMLDRVQHDPTRHQNGGNFPRVSQTWLLISSRTQVISAQVENHCQPIGRFSRNAKIKTRIAKREKEVSLLPCPAVLSS